MTCRTVTLRALQDMMTFCAHHAHEAAALAIEYAKQPVEVQIKAKELMRNIISEGDIGTMPPERLRELALWINMPPTTIPDQNRVVLQIRCNPGEKVMIQELADALTDGNKSKLIMLALMQFAGVEF